LSPKHHIFETPLFLDESLLGQLSTRVRTGNGCTETHIRPTGIPPHVAILCEMKWVKDGLVDTLSKIETTRTDTVKDIITELEKGEFRRVQSDFAIPDCSVRQMWLLWVYGNKTKQIPPLRQLDGRDMPSRKLQKRLSQLRYVMSKIEKAAASKNLLHDSQNVDEATQVFVACAGSVDVDRRTEHSRKRRRGQLSWATVGKLLRKMAKQQ
ncbi:hypothetical protein PHMEG_00028108, partial [Phytophthora megakarya]